MSANALEFALVEECSLPIKAVRLTDDNFLNQRKFDRSCALVEAKLQGVCRGPF